MQPVQPSSNPQPVYNNKKKQQQQNKQANRDTKQDGDEKNFDDELEKKKADTKKPMSNNSNYHMQQKKMAQQQAKQTASNTVDSKSATVKQPTKVVIAPKNIVPKKAVIGAYQKSQNYRNDPTRAKITKEEVYVPKVKIIWEDVTLDGNKLLSEFKYNPIDEFAKKLNDDILFWVEPVSDNMILISQIDNAMKGKAYKIYGLQEFKDSEKTDSENKEIKYETLVSMIVKITRDKLELYVKAFFEGNNDELIIKKVKITFNNSDTYKDLVNKINRFLTKLIDGKL